MHKADPMDKVYEARRNEVNSTLIRVRRERRTEMVEKMYLEEGLSAGAIADVLVEMREFRNRAAAFKFADGVISGLWMKAMPDVASLR